MVDELPALLQVVDHARRRTVDLPHRRRRPRDEDQEHAHAAGRVLGQVVLGDLMLALAGLAIDHRDPVRLGGRTDTDREPAREAHQVRVVQSLITVCVPPPPPRPKAAGRMPESSTR